MDTAERVRALRVALGWTQEELGTRAGYASHPRIYVSKIERGTNQLSTWSARQQLAQGFGLPVEALLEYLDGRAELEPTLARRAPEAPAPSPKPAAESHGPASLEVAAIQRFDAQRHTPEDLDAVRAVLRRAPAGVRWSGPLGDAAARWLDAAAALRAQGVEVTAEALLLHLTLSAVGDAGG